jgi:hypothetical protein
MPYNVKQELFKLFEFSPSTAVRFPPAIGIKVGIVRRADKDFRRVTFHGTKKHSTQTS